MTAIMAKIRSRKNDNKYREMVATNKPIFNCPSKIIESVYPYSPGSVLNEGEWFVYEAFSRTVYTIPLLSAAIDSPSYDRIKREEIDKVEYLFMLQGNTIYFQQTSKAKLIQKKALYFISGELEYRDDVISIQVNDLPDAIYDKTNDKLYFRNLSGISRIFPGISDLYREATIDEVNDFLQLDGIQLTDGFTAENVKIPNRKRIALAKVTLDKLGEDERNTVFLYIGDYCPNIKGANGRFTIGSDEDLKMLLFGIEQRYYTTIVGNEKRIANSIIPLS